jgi:predicted nuclease of predicted toxin-antitoxin system
MKLLLDEIVPLPIVRHLRDLGCDAVHVRERGWLAKSDGTTWATAQGEGRTLITFTSAHLLRLVRRARNHAGLILITPPAITSIDELWRHIAHALAGSPRGLAGCVIMCPAAQEAPRQLRQVRLRPARLRPANDTHVMALAAVDAAE